MTRDDTDELAAAADRAYDHFLQRIREAKKKQEAE